MSTPEGIVKSAMLDYLNISGHRFFRMNSGRVKVRGGWMHLAPEGCADFLICLSRCPPAWCEVKCEGQTTTAKRKAAQAAFADDMKALGHAHRICNSVAELVSFLGDVVSGRIA